MTKNNSKAEEILQKLLRNESVSRWDVYTHRKEIRGLIIENEEYHEIQNEVEVIIDTAKDSL
jgi:hypothetical protein